jgi:hypothetical protein
VIGGAATPLPSAIDSKGSEPVQQLVMRDSMLSPNQPPLPRSDLQATSHRDHSDQAILQKTESLLIHPNSETSETLRLQNSVPQTESLGLSASLTRLRFCFEAKISKMDTGTA